MTGEIKPNNDWLLDRKKHSGRGSKGKIIWKDNGKEVKNYTLFGKELKSLRRACNEADRQEVMLGVPVHVIVNKVLGEAIITIEAEIEKE